jgi:hypothetical protein
VKLERISAHAVAWQPGNFIGRWQPTTSENGDSSSPLLPAPRTLTRQSRAPSAALLPTTASSSSPSCAGRRRRFTRSNSEPRILPGGRAGPRAERRRWKEEAAISGAMSFDSDASSQGGDQRSFRQITRDRNYRSPHPAPDSSFLACLLLLGVEMDLAKLLAESKTSACIF